jgi:SAM-dependent methyltransferase
MASSKRLASGLRRARPPLASPRVAGRPRGTNRVTAWTRTKRLVHGSSFGAPAAAYAEHRPGYAQAAVRWALDPAPGPLVLDLGAGTGKLSATLVALGAEVIAVRPDSEMLTELRRALPTVRALAGSAEAVPLPDASVDAVRAGHALRWFDIDVAGPEIARVLVPGGIPAGLWNVIENRVDWTAGLERVSGSAAIGPRDRSAARAPRRQTRTFQTLACSPSSARRSRPSSRTGSAAPATRDNRDEGWVAGHARPGTSGHARSDPGFPREQIGDRPRRVHPRMLTGVLRVRRW